ncbi:lipoprotein-releasing ABC transporter permease subunit [Desulfonatronovibrio hydrogenovorans]|uniref:lipoprotein-releasing ABC transporter permease subunit n=1 Tax=Desulfonatronovibrio hydrogenovorans TaxID=53245 RepID=UPI0004914CCD|nr:lipoprotein-releasing ABC transporter permease subunit [Desulfonatronovibrio hydrogenovorans]
MTFEFFIALRYLRAKREQAFISVISLVSILGVALGVASLIIVLGVMNGFSQNLRDKILGINAHVLVGSYTGGIPDYFHLAGELEEIPGVRGVAPFIYTEVMLSSPGGVKGVVLRGIDPQQASNVLSLDREMISGRVQDLEEERDFPGIIIGRELATGVGVGRGDTVNILSPSGGRSSAGFTPTVSTFEVRGIFRTGMYEYDSSFGYTSISAAQSILGFREDLVTGLELRVFDADQAHVAAGRVGEFLGGYPFYVRHWMEMNQNLFAALKLEKIAMGVILAMIVLVGSFSIITALVMLVMEKTRDIAVMMSMGATRATIRRIFIILGMMIGTVGTALGFAFGLGISHLLKKYQFIRLPADVYYLDHLPVLHQTGDLVLIGLAAMLLCFMATIYPARKASNLNPADALRYE